MVILLDKHKKPLGFATERRVRRLCERRRAVLYRMFPAVVIVRDVDVRTLPALPRYRIKIDPGAKQDGIAIIRDDTDEIVWAMQVEHRGQSVRRNLDTRRAARRNRRFRETWYRRSRFADGGRFAQERHGGTLPPSVRSVIGNTETWVRRLMKWINLQDASFEAVRFDTQKMDNPDIEGRQYQAGTLAGMEIREYLLDRYQHTCQYCGGASGDPVLEWEHIVPRSRGGSDSVKNATLACRCCNREKGARTPAEWLAGIRGKPHASRLDKARMEGIRCVMAHRPAGGSNRYCAWVNVTRKALEAFLYGLFEEVECASGGRTKYNRTRLGFPKDHQYDAACVGSVPGNGYRDRTHGYYVLAQAAGRGTRFRGKINQCGIITHKLGPRPKRIFGFMNGDIVRADVPHKAPRPYKN